MVVQALESVSDEIERESLVTLQSDLEQLIQLTQENLDSIKTSKESTEVPTEAPKEIDDEYALFMVRWNLITFYIIISRKPLGRPLPSSWTMWANNNNF